MTREIVAMFRIHLLALVKHYPERHGAVSLTTHGFVAAQCRTGSLPAESTSSFNYLRGLSFENSSCSFMLVNIRQYYWLGRLLVCTPSPDAAWHARQSVLSRGKAQ